MLLGARTTAKASARGHRGDEATVAERQQDGHADADADPRAAREREAEGDEHGRQHEQWPHAVAAAEQQAGRRDARHEHQRTRVRHVVGERALRTTTEVVEVQEAVLEQADEGAGRADGDDHGGEEVGPMAAREPVDQRHDQEEHQLLGVDQADGGVDRGGGGDEGDGGIGGEGPEEDGHLELLLPHHEQRAPAQERQGEQDARGGHRQLQRCDKAQEDRQRERLEAIHACSSQCRRGHVVLDILLSRRRPGCRERQGPLGSRDDRVDGDVRQAPEISGYADALFARPAGQCPDIDSRAPKLRVTPRRRPHRQGGPVQTHDGRPGGRGHVQRPAVSADVEPCPANQGMQLVQRHIPAGSHRLRGRGPALTHQTDHLGSSCRLRWSGRQDDTTIGSAHGQSIGQAQRKTAAASGGTHCRR